MAGAGYKLFNTGDVLTAAQVNTYLMEQTVMVFADAAARTTALTGVVSEGMLSYLKDTNAVEVYNGSAWVSSDDPNAIQNTIVDAKGDLITATAADTPARLAVGNSGETLVADSAATTGLRWQGNYAAGKNAIINGDFNINQRAFTSNTTTDLYNFDRWQTVNSDGTVTSTPQTFTPGTAPVAGYESKNFLRIQTTGQTLVSARANFAQKIESVRTFAGQTVTVSFWAKANSGTPSVSIEAFQNFGTGGSPSASVSGSVAAGTTSKKTISTSWARYSATLTIPSISGKTLGTTNDGFLSINLWVSGGSDFNTRTDSIGIQTNTFDFWGVQVEAGSVATAFQTATSTLQSELAACQRYYYRTTGGETYSHIAFGVSFNTTTVKYDVVLPVTMRVRPTSIEWGNLAINFPGGGGGSGAATTITAVGTESSKNLVNIEAQKTGLTATTPYFLINDNNTAGYFAANAEL